MAGEMEAGELETRKAFEDVTTRNVRAAVEFSNTTRTLVRTLEDTILIQGELMRQNQSKIEELQLSISNLNMRLYVAGIE